METWEIRCDIRDEQGIPIIYDTTVCIQVRQKLRGRITSGPRLVKDGVVSFENQKLGYLNRLLVTKNGSTCAIDVIAAVKTSAEP